MWDWQHDMFNEVIAPGAFTESLTDRDQKALWNHDWSKPLGSVRANTLTFEDNETELTATMDLPSNTWGDDAYESVKRGDVDGTSFGFTVLDEKWEQDGDKYVRTILRAKLYEVSPCTLPAYDANTSDVRCKSHFEKKDTNDLEKMKLKLKLKLN